MGNVPITNINNQPVMRTLTNYKALIANNKGVSICTTVTPKTTTRYTSENSLISSMALLCVIASTHYIAVTEIQHKVEKEVREEDEGVKMLYSMISKSHNNLPIFPIRPELVLSTDDTVNYIFDGKSEEKDLFRLVSTKALLKSGT